MKTLFLVRHAKSSWRNSELSDIDRPLKERGIRNAYQMGEHLQSAGGAPDLIITSPAARAMHTAIIFARQLSFPMHRMRINGLLYHGGQGGIMEMLNQLDNRFDSVMIVGHNPTFTNMVNQLSDGELDNLPTSGVAEIRFDVERWAQLNMDATGTLQQVVIPKQL